jgi:hypothetical protein
VDSSQSTPSICTPLTVQSETMFLTPPVSSQKPRAEPFLMMSRVKMRGVEP